MRLLVPAILVFVVTIRPAQAQEKKRTQARHYFSVRIGAVAPLGVFDDTYYGGLGLNGTMHFKRILKNGELQVVTGYERFLAKKGNIFGQISTIPLKVGILQMISKEFYLYVRTGMLAVKDKKTPYSMRFSTDAGLGYAFKKFAVDIGFHGWARKGGRFTNYFSAGAVLPFNRSN